METLLYLAQINPTCAALSIAVVVWVAWSWAPAMPGLPLDWWAGRQELERLQATVNANPHNATAQAELGRMLVVRGRHPEAIQHLELAVQRMEESAEPHYYLGLAHLGRGDWSTGKREVDLALRLRPELHYGEPYLRLGDFQAEMGEPEQALDFYREFTGINASSSEGFYKRGIIEQQLGDLPAARASWREAVAAYAQSPAYKRVNRSWSWKAWFALRRH